MHINLIARTNGVGLDQDADLIFTALTAAGMQVTISHCRSIPFWKKWLPQTPRYDANIFLERVFPSWFGTARKNFLIPNQERYPKRHLRFLRHIDTVLCKTQHAEEIFSQHARACFIGFTSKDRAITAVTPDFQSYLHLAGRSTLKGSETLLALWAKHPEWPALTLIQCEENAPASVPDNIHLISEYLSTEELLMHLNMHGVHLCPSLSEGWGHYIVEAMSCRALVVTTDAPPMNELIQPDRGTLISTHKSEPRHLGTNYYVDPDALESALRTLIAAPADSKKLLGITARAWFEKNDEQFNATFPAIIRDLLS